MLKLVRKTRCKIIPSKSTSLCFQEIVCKSQLEKRQLLNFTSTLNLNDANSDLYTYALHHIICNCHKKQNVPQCDDIKTIN